MGHSGWGSGGVITTATTVFITEAGAAAPAAEWNITLIIARKLIVRVLKPVEKMFNSNMRRVFDEDPFFS